MVRFREGVAGVRGAPALWRPSRRTLAFVLLGCAAVTVTCLVVVHGDYPLDLRMYVLGGRTALHGHGVYGPAARLGRYGFTYPPFAAVIFTLPAMLPTAVLYALMCILSASSLVLLIALCVPRHIIRAASNRSLTAAAAIGALAVIEPVRVTFADGQIGLLLAAAVAYDVLVPDRRRCGILIGVATAIKLTPGLFIVYLCIRRRYADAGRAVASFAGAEAIAALLLPGDSLHYWTSTLPHGTGVGNYSSVHNHSLNGIWQRATHSGAFVLWLLTAGVTAVVGLALASSLIRQQREVFAAGIVGVTACLISPVSWPHHWVWFIAAFAGLRTDAVHPRVANGVVAVSSGYLVLANFLPPSLVGGNVVARLLGIYAYAGIAAVIIVVGCVEVSGGLAIPPAARRGKAHKMRQVGPGGASRSEPMWTWRGVAIRFEPADWRLPGRAWRVMGRRPVFKAARARVPAGQ